MLVCCDDNHRRLETGLIRIIASRERNPNLIVQGRIARSTIPSARQILDSNHGLLRQDGFQDAQIVAAEDQGDFLFLVAVFLEAGDQIG